jgi:mono/diheme cytochrome c family protein
MGAAMEKLALNRFWLALLPLSAIAGIGHGAESGLQHGKALLETMCARCHATGKTGRSPHADAPPFRRFADEKLYDNDFAQRLQDGLSAIHPDMPTFHFNGEDAEDVVDYLRSIQEHGKPKAAR